ncbi:TetR/AcrR family transcriptional regulator [Paraglaciecola marina]|uniref:TetR/AcrR family transcriptional regulator n=1 Tax=Paraglaciecola marina TaxID=2500157 RepID=UPI00105E2E24|nr:TetR/AcrR family transcriptional regulator [Paraglaciecola marina]
MLSKTINRITIELMIDNKNNGQKRGSYKAGVEKQKKIIDTTRMLIIEEGYTNFSFRKVAKKVGISVGNLQHYFATKNELFDAMLKSVIGEYLLTIESLKYTVGCPEDYLYEVIQYVVKDLTTFETTRFFPELWSLSNHDENVDALVQHMYEEYRKIYAEIAQQINPKIDKETADSIALFISSTIEGHAIFIGHDKKYASSCDKTIKMTYASAIYIIKEAHLT